MEKKFKEFCINRGWEIHKIPELSGIKTQDFFVIVNNCPFIVEVKNLEESGPERADIKKIEADGATVQFGDYNKEIDSISRKIDEARQQFKSTKSFNLPNIIIIYSERPVILDKEIIFQATYGKVFQRLLIREFQNDSKKNSLSLPPLIIDRTLRQDKNNLISAVGIPNGEGGMFILHNLWADVTFPATIFSKEKDVNYVPKEIKFQEIIFK